MKHLNFRSTFFGLVIAFSAYAFVYVNLDKKGRHLSNIAIENVSSKVDVEKYSVADEVGKFIIMKVKEAFLIKL